MQATIHTMCFNNLVIQPAVNDVLTIFAVAYTACANDGIVYLPPLLVHMLPVHGDHLVDVAPGTKNETNLLASLLLM